MSATAGDDRLVDALRAEHAAVYGYGMVGARLDARTVDAARQAEQAHRGRRDTLLVRLTDRGIAPPPAEPAYALPFAVTDQASALRLAVDIEERVAAVWRRVLPDTIGDDRVFALDALTDGAVRAARLRRLAGLSPATVPLPGAPA